MDGRYSKGLICSEWYNPRMIRRAFFALLSAPFLRKVFPKPKPKPFNPLSGNWEVRPDSQKRWIKWVPFAEYDNEGKVVKVLFRAEKWL